MVQTRSRPNRKRARTDSSYEDHSIDEESQVSPRNTGQSATLTTGQDEPSANEPHSVVPSQSEGSLRQAPQTESSNAGANPQSITAGSQVMNMNVIVPSIWGAIHKGNHQLAAVERRESLWAAERAKISSDMSRLSAMYGELSGRLSTHGASLDQVRKRELPQLKQQITTQSVQNASTNGHSQAMLQIFQAMAGSGSLNSNITNSSHLTDHGRGGTDAFPRQKRPHMDELEDDMARSLAESTPNKEEAKIRLASTMDRLQKKLQYYIDDNQRKVELKHNLESARPQRPDMGTRNNDRVVYPPFPPPSIGQTKSPSMQAAGSTQTHSGSTPILQAPPQQYHKHTLPTPTGPLYSRRKLAPKAQPGDPSRESWNALGRGTANDRQ